MYDCSAYQDVGILRDDGFVCPWEDVCCDPFLISIPTTVEGEDGDGIICERDCWNCDDCCEPPETECDYPDEGIIPPGGLLCTI